MSNWGRFQVSGFRFQVAGFLFLALSYKGEVLTFVDFFTVVCYLISAISLYKKKKINKHTFFVNYCYFFLFPCFRHLCK
ncbi:hypothetical protein CSQ80_12050 [Cyanobacterium aponinum IPPAS B-1201]|nr:hypothetical protein CSQ80_12050 [Cyanobacterium aponinum IPPAS B-1201]